MSKPRCWPTVSVTLRVSFSDPRVSRRLVARSEALRPSESASAMIWRRSPSVLVSKVWRASTSANSHAGDRPREAHLIVLMFKRRSVDRQPMDKQSSRKPDCKNCNEMSAWAEGAARTGCPGTDGFAYGRAGSIAAEPLGRSRCPLRLSVHSGAAIPLSLRVVGQAGWYRSQAVRLL